MRLIRSCTLPALLAVLALLSLAPQGAAFAAETTLSHVTEGMDDGVRLFSSSHYANMVAPGEWTNRFAQSIDIYCKRYGDVSGIKGIVVFYQAPEDKTDITTSYTVLGRQLFDLSSAPEQFGWLRVPLDPIKLPERFGVGVFTYSDDKRGVEVGMTPKRRDSVSNSYVMGAAGKIDRKFKPNLTRDGREWMFKLTVRDTLDPRSSIAAADLSGKGFAYHDDGSAETYVTAQKHGGLVHFNNSSPRRLKRIYLYGKTEGDWLDAYQHIAVSILDSEMGIVQHLTVPYSSFTNVPSWVSVDVPDISIPSDFYVLVEPNSRPIAQFLLGDDTSGTNHGSSWAVVGAHMAWQGDAPQDKSNFMVRVEYR